jgi:hypothetical protein
MVSRQLGHEVQYLCHDCAISVGHLRPAAPVALTATQYQLKKYLKHTVPASAQNFNTVFTSPASSTYANFLITTVASGHVQIDDAGRLNVVWVASCQTGISLQGGQFLGPTDAVKVVLQTTTIGFMRFQFSLRSCALRSARSVDETSRIEYSVG